MENMISSNNNDRVESLKERITFVNLCEPANIMFTPEYLSDLQRSKVAVSNITTAFPWGDIHHHLERYGEFFKQFDEQNDKVEPVFKFDDIETTRNSGKISFILGLQGLDFIGSDLYLLSLFKKLGLLITTLTYNRRNSIGDGMGEPDNSGLSVFGQQAVEELNRLGILIDTAHVGLRTSLHAAEHSKDPIVSTHSNCFSLVPNKRNATDELIHALSEKGGLISLVAHAPFVREDQQPTIKDLVNHMKHIEKIGSIDNIAIGMDIYPWHKIPGEEAFMSSLRSRFPETKARPYQFGKLPDLRDATEWGNMVSVMASEGYSDDDISKVMGGNALRVLKRVWK